MAVIETQRLLLRELTPDDLDNLFALYRDPEVRRYYPDGTRTLEETQRELASMIRDYSEFGYGLWATIEKQTNRFIGRCGLIPWTVEDQLEVEVAYLLDKAYWGKGLGFEAAQASMRYGFQQIGLPRIVCMMFAANKGSRGIAKKLGMTFQQNVEVQGQPALKYAIERAEFEKGIAATPK